MSRRLLIVILSSLILFVASAATFDQSGGSLLPPKYSAMSEALQGVPRIAPSAGNDLEVIIGGPRKWELLIADLEAAKDYILLDYFYFHDDYAGNLIKDVIMRRAREGVTVKLCFENVSSPTMGRGFFEDMKRSGVEVRYFTDADSLSLGRLFSRVAHRNHRKIVVIDGAVAYTGGMNLTDSYLYYWRDTHVRVTGPAVEGLQAIFNADWEIGGGQSVPFVPSELPAPERPGTVFTQTVLQPVSVEGGTRDFECGLDSVFKTCDSLIYIQTPYFCPSKRILASLKEAVRRGLDVRLLIPEITDEGALTLANKSFYKECIEAGVRIWEYVDGFDHSKVIIADGGLTLFGSVNFDVMSLICNYEDLVAAFDGQINSYMREMYMGILSGAHEMSLEEVESWGFFKRLSHGAMRLLGPVI